MGPPWPSPQVTVAARQAHSMLAMTMGNFYPKARSSLTNIPQISMPPQSHKHCLCLTNIQCFQNIHSEPSLWLHHAAANNHKNRRTDSPGSHRWMVSPQSAGVHAALAGTSLWTPSHSQASCTGAPLGWADAPSCESPCSQRRRMSSHSPAPDTYPGRNSRQITQYEITDTYPGRNTSQTLCCLALCLTLCCLTHCCLALSDTLLSDTLLSRPGNQGLWENNMWMVITYCQKTALGSHEASLPGQQRTYNLSQK